MQTQGKLSSHSQKEWLPKTLFLLGLLVYLLTRLIRLPGFPIYFFTDEAIQTQHAADLIANGFQGSDGTFLPTYFENGGQYNLSLSVYLQVLPTLIFGKSIWVTRGVSVVISLLVPVFTGLILKDGFKIRSWWLAPLLISVIPAWFLHSRTAFETILMTSFYAGFFYFYLRYRQDHPKSLYLALAFGALAFYAYSPGQVIMVVTGILFLIADARYHWHQRRTALTGLGILFLSALPYIRFLVTREGATLQHLTLLNTYWVKPLPLHEKLGMYILRYLQGFNPFYWFWPNPSLLERIWPEIALPAWLFSNQLDLARHTMKGYGHFLSVTFPLWIFGIIQSFRKFKKPTHRALLLALLAIPSGAALVDWGITRGMAFIIPSTLLVALGLATVLTWLRQKTPAWQPEGFPGLVFILAAAFSVWMLTDALQQGPTWYRDYGLGGMQYGGRQVFARAAEIARTEPETTVLVSSTWANGADVLMRYFTDGIPNLKMGNINAFAFQYQPLDRQTLFVMTEDDLTLIEVSGKFTHVSIEETLTYPDGRTGFYFIRLEYVEDIHAILKAEREARQSLQTKTLLIHENTVRVQYPLLDMGEIDQAFDGDPTTLIRTLETNPLRMILTFSEPINLHSVTLLLGGTPTEITLTTQKGDQKLETLEKVLLAAPVKREVSLAFDPVQETDQLLIEVFNPHDGEIAHVHLWEVTLE